MGSPPSSRARAGRRPASIALRIAAGLLGLLCAAGAGAADIKIATVAPDGSHWMEQMRAGADEIKMRTGGRVTLKFYPGGVMGNDAQVLRKIRVGQLQGGAFTAGGLAERYPALNLYGIPLLFRSLNEVDAVRARLDPKLLAGLEQAGFIAFGFTEGGFANLLSNEPIRSVDDMKRKKVWVPEGDQISFLAMESLGLSPVVLPVTDVLTGLQTGLIEIAFSSPVAALVLQWQTRVKYRTDLPISYSYGVFAIEKGAFNALSADDQKAVREVMTRVMGGLDRAARDDNKRAAEVLATSGVQAVPVDAASVEDWRRSIESLYPQLRERSDFDKPLFDELMSALADYRKSHPEASSGAR
jgi:TRAP-type C4-dicarboxylate transport system substrate-binding protein